VINYSQDKEKYLPSVFKDNSEKIKKKMEAKGLYNGPIACCSNFKVEDSLVSIDCVNFGLFELSLNKFKGNRFPPILNVNAIVEVEDGFILFKREKKVYSYPEYWDFPAGIVPFKDTPLMRMKDRLVIDTKLNSEDFEVENEPFLITHNRKSFALYYKAKCKKKKEKF